jgi:cytochrome c
MATGLLISVAIMASSACASSGSTTSTNNPSTSQTTPSTSTTPTSSTEPTYGSLALTGQNVFTTRCSSCHGNQGQGITGPALIGTTSSLDKYMTAQGLLDFISTQMPLNNPGGLAHQDYLDVLCFLMVKNSFVDIGGAFVESSLASVQLKYP